MITRILGYLSAMSFQRGLALGAMVGAAIAGSTLWTRIREARERDAPGDSAMVPADAFAIDATDATDAEPIEHSATP